MVKDEGWIDEVGDEENNSEDGSSPYTSEEEEEDWSDDLSSIKSVDCKTVEEDWLKDDFSAKVEEELQQSATSGLGGTRPNENIESRFKENNDYYEEGVYNSQEEANGQVRNWNSHHAVSPTPSKHGNEDEIVVKAQYVDPPSCEKSPTPINSPAGLKKGRHMTITCRRRGMFSDKARRSEKTAACPKSSYSGHGSKSRNSTELSEVKPGEDIADSLSLRKLGSQIGFTWGLT
ncbi:hypothetical protein L1887_24160 [Cichorium endivia]|nr:hypothetical protein L1887_24160 [Cichorium endivia]